MTKQEVKLYFKDNPEEILDRTIGIMDYHDDLDELEQSEDDINIFYYVSEPNEMTYLKDINNDEEFVVL